MTPIKVSLINKSTNENPTYATPGSSGMDIRANLESDLSLKPLQRVLVPTGLFLEIPQGYEAQVRPRSGLAIKQGLTCLNTPGTIDSDYRGEIKVILINFDSEVQTIKHGDRIAQLIFSKIEQATLIPSATISNSSRGTGGFGHTGIN